MVFLYAFFAILLIFILWDFTRGFRLRLVTGLDQGGMDASVQWLYPFLMITIRAGDGIPVMSIFLLKLRLYHRQLKLRPGGRKSAVGKTLVRAAELSHISISASYGFRDPFMTGIAFAAASVASSQFGIEQLSLAPDYLSNSNHLHMEANVNLKIGQTIINYIKSKF